MREQPWSRGMGKWSRFSLGCKVCDNYLRKHREGRAGFTWIPHSLQAPGVQLLQAWDMIPQLCPTQASLTPSFPGILRNPYLIPHAIGVFPPGGAELLIRAAIAPNPGFWAAGSSLTALHTD